MATTATIPTSSNPVTSLLNNSLRWKTATAFELKVLGSLQGNILKGHGRDHTWHIFFKLGKDTAKSKRLLRELGNHHVTSAHAQLIENERFKQEHVPGGTFLSVLLSHSGYADIGINFPIPASNDAFSKSMKDPSANLGDDPNVWEVAFKESIDAMVLIADDDITRGSIKAADMARRIADAGGSIMRTQIGKAIRDASQRGLEHFGYVDGRSQPLLLWEDIEKEAGDEGVSQWDPAFPLGAALVPDTLALMTDPKDLSKKISDPSAFGSFLIFRKLEQNVRGFKTREQELADVLLLKGDDRERAGALVVGRFEDGTPVTMAASAMDLEKPHNDFDYRGDLAGGRCPLHAHIRKTNPRGSGGFELHDAERRHIMPRRGITYEDVAREVHPGALPDAETTSDFKRDVAPLLPTGGVGLLFMAYNSRLDDQFVFTQRIWVNNTGFPKAAISPGLDPILGQGANVPGGQVYPKAWDEPAKGSAALDFKDFVTTRGGEYFFAPSLTFLRNL